LSAAIAARSKSPGACEALQVAAERLRKFSPDKYYKCHECNELSCFSCLDDRSIGMCSSLSVAVMQKEISTIEGRALSKCTRCYWSSKPCTNPNCPNKVGIPTKRCGDCHLDRYCSVECQVAAHPGHVARCQRIQARRAAAGKV
jgi:hypothetical protein